MKGKEKKERNQLIQVQARQPTKGARRQPITERQALNLDKMNMPGKHADK